MDTNSRTKNAQTRRRNAKRKSKKIDVGGIKEMKMLYDDIVQIYVWVDDEDENIELSPHFDYEEDAEQWFIRMKQELNLKQ